MPTDSTWTKLIDALSSPEWIVLVLVLLGAGVLLWKLGGAALTLLREFFAGLREEMTDVKAELKGIREEVSKLNVVVARVEERQERLEDRVERIEDDCRRRHN